MGTPSQTRERTEALLEISNSILAAVIGGAWDEVDDLERQRAVLFEQVLNDREISSVDRIFLIGALEHIRGVDATTRNFLSIAPDDDWLDAMHQAFTHPPRGAGEGVHPVERDRGYRIWAM